MHCQHLGNCLSKFQQDIANVVINKNISVRDRHYYDMERHISLAAMATPFVQKKYVLPTFSPPLLTACYTKDEADWINSVLQ